MGLHVCTPKENSKPTQLDLQFWYVNILRFFNIISFVKYFLYFLIIYCDMINYIFDMLV